MSSLHVFLTEIFHRTDIRSFAMLARTCHNMQDHAFEIVMDSLRIGLVDMNYKCPFKLFAIPYDSLYEEDLFMFCPDPDNCSNCHSACKNIPPMQSYFGQYL